MYKLLSNILLSRLTPYAEEIIVDFDATGQPLIIYSAFVKYKKKKKNGNTLKQGIIYKYL
jgi:hypothetical protein